MMDEENGLEVSSDKDTDVESLPEVTHSKPHQKSNQNVWILHQQKDSEENTDSSLLEGVEEEVERPSKKVSRKKKTKKFEIGFSSSTVTIRSQGQAIRFKRDDMDSYNVEEEVITVDISKRPLTIRHAEPPKSSIPKSVVETKEEEKEEGKNDEESDDSGEDQPTDNDLVQVSFEDYQEIINAEALKHERPQELKSYEACITQREDSVDANVQDDQDTTEDEMSNAAGASRPDALPDLPAGAVGKDEDDDDDDDDPQTDDSCLEVPMMEYYKIRHQTDPSTCKSNGNLNDNSEPKFDCQHFFQSIAKSSTRITSTGNDNEPVTDEDVSSNSDEDYQENKEESEDEVTRNSDLQVTMRDYYAIRKETTLGEAADEYVLMMNQVQSLIRMTSIDKNEQVEKPGRFWFDATKEFLESNREVDSDDNISTDDEQMSYELNPNQDEPPNDDCYSIENQNEGSHVDMRDKFLKPVHKTSKMQSEEVSISEAVPIKCSNIPVIRLVEMDGFQAALGVCCMDPMSPTRDDVFGVRFIDTEITEEISNISDMDDQSSLAECGHHSPATEDEPVSEFELDSVPSKQEYSLPAAKCQIYYTKVLPDGKSTTIEKNIQPNEYLSLNQFIKETENVSECDLLQVSDDEVEELPKDRDRKPKKVTIQAKPKKTQPLPKSPLANTPKKPSETLAPHLDKPARKKKTRGGGKKRADHLPRQN